MLLTEAVRSIPVVGKAFAPGEVPQPQGAQISWSFPGERDPARKIGDGSSSSLVAAVLNWYYRKFPDAILRVYEEQSTGHRVPIIPHDISTLIERPNEYYDGDALWAGLVYSFIIDGNGYWLKARNAATRVAELWWMPHQFIEPKGDPNPMRPDAEFITSYEVNLSGMKWNLEPNDVFHARFGSDPKNPRKGISQLKAQLREVLTDEEAARFSSAMVQNVGIPGVIMSPKSETATIDEPTALKNKARYEQEFTGSNTGRVMFLSGSMMIEQLGFSPEQLTLRDLRAIPEERVTAALGLPAAVVGFGTGLAQTKVGATMKELREQAVEDALVPMWRSLARQAEGALVHEFSGGRKNLRLGFDTSEVRELQEDRQRLHERTRGDVQGSIITVSTSQAILGYEVDQSQDVYLRSPLQTEVPASRGGRRGQRERPKEKAEGGLTDSQRLGLAYLRFVDAGTRSIERAFTTSLTGAFERLGSRAADIFAQAPKQDPADEELVESILGSLRIDAEAEVGPAYRASYEASARLAIAGAEEALGVTLTIGAQDTIALRLIEAGGRRVGLLDLSAQTRSALFEALHEARSEGLGIPQTARRIREHVSAGPFPHAGVRYRADTIARTELFHARRLSTVEVGRGAGFEAFVAFDDRLGFGDDACAARNGQEFTADEVLGEDDHPRGTLSFSPIPRTGRGDDGDA